MRRVPALAVLVAAACATGPRPSSATGATPSRPLQAALAAGPEGGFETGRLTTPDQAVTGPFVLTYLAAGAQLVVGTAGGGDPTLGPVVGPLAQPFHLAAGASLRLAAPGDAVYAGYRPMPITRALDAYLGRQIWISIGAGQPEQWVLREIGGDHVTIERSRTYRVVAVRRISEITWTDLTGADPTPRVVLAPQ